MANVPNGINIAENFNHLCRAHERYRQTTDGRTTTYSEREREFTFANKTKAPRHAETFVTGRQACSMQYKHRQR